MNENLFYVINHDICKDAIIDYIKVRVDKVSKQLKKRFPCDYYFNQVTDKSGKVLGYGYLWISNPEVFRMINGRNPDGSERVIVSYERDPEVLERELNKALDKAFETDDLMTMHWADIQEKEDRIRYMYRPVEIKKELPPLIDLDPLRKQFAGLVVTPFVAKPGESHIIYSHKIPEWLTKDAILKEFQPFSKKKLEVVLSGSKDRRSCQVIFPKYGIEAQLALAMKAKIYLTDPKTKEPKIVLFRMDNYKRVDRY
jgi:hypothetical protein